MGNRREVLEEKNSKRGKRKEGKGKAKLKQMSLKEGRKVYIDNWTGKWEGYFFHRKWQGKNAVQVKVNKKKEKRE